MRIATNSFYDRQGSAMASLTAKADALQGSIASGKKLDGPSADAAAYRQITVLHRAAADQTQDSTNIDLAQSMLSASDTALASIETQLQRAHELAVRATSGTLSADQKASIATELDSILTDIVKLANATDSRGQPLFSGSSDQPPYAIDQNGSVTYSGVGEAGAIPIGDGATVQATTSGAQIFNSVSTTAGSDSVFGIVRSLAAGLRSGTDVSNALSDLTSALGAVGDARASVGARGARLDLETTRLADAATTRETIRSGLEDTDMTKAITELQKTLTILQATQASFTKLTSLSLFDYLR